MKKLLLISLIATNLLQAGANWSNSASIPDEAKAEYQRLVSWNNELVNENKQLKEENKNLRNLNSTLIESLKLSRKSKN